MDCEEGISATGGIRGSPSLTCVIQTMTGIISPVSSTALIFTFTEFCELTKNEHNNKRDKE